MSNTTRPETGPMQFSGDWPGTFIRGDVSYHFARNLSAVLMWLDGAESEDAELSKRAFDEVKMHALGLRALMAELDRCNVHRANHDPSKVQKLKTFDTCAKEPSQAPAVIPDRVALDILERVPVKPEAHTGTKERVDELAGYIASGHHADGSIRRNWSQPDTTDWIAATILALDEATCGVRYASDEARRLADAMKIGYTVG